MWPNSQETEESLNGKSHFFVQCAFKQGFFHINLMRLFMQMYVTRGVNFMIKIDLYYCFLQLLFWNYFESKINMTLTRCFIPQIIHMHQFRPSRPKVSCKKLFTSNLFRTAFWRNTPPLWLLPMTRHFKRLNLGVIDKIAKLTSREMCSELNKI